MRGSAPKTAPRSSLDNGPAADPDILRRQRATLALRLASPKRAGPGRVLQAQADAGHLPLFIAANEPRLV